MKITYFRLALPAIALFSLTSIFSCKNEAPEAAQTTHEPKANTMEGHTIDTSFRKMFEEINMVKMHFFGTSELEPNKDDYPYTGQKIEGDAAKFLGDGLQSNETGAVYATYKAENYNLYVLRVPGKYASSDLALAKWDDASKKLVKIYDLANLQCDEGLCHQQDAWLTDLDDDRVLDLVVRSHSNDNGKISDEKFMVMAQPSPGNFAQAPEGLASLAPQTSYVLHEKTKTK